LSIRVDPHDVGLLHRHSAAPKLPGGHFLNARAN
jgi:hypothetical protein